MRITSATNLQWATADHTILDCIVTFDSVLTGPHAIGVTANADTAYLQKLWTDANNGVYGPIAPYSVPTPTVDEQKAAIMAQLDALDAYIPRGLEDYWTASGFNTSTLPSIQQTRLAQKISLRAQLAAL